MASGPTSVAASIGSPTFSAGIRVDEAPLELVGDASRATMKRLAAMQDWPLLIVRALTAVRDRGVEVGARHHDERIAAAELEHASS